MNDETFAAKLLVFVVGMAVCFTIGGVVAAYFGG